MFVEDITARRRELEPRIARLHALPLAARRTADGKQVEPELEAPTAEIDGLVSELQAAVHRNRRLTHAASVAQDRSEGGGQRLAQERDAEPKRREPTGVPALLDPFRSQPVTEDAARQELNRVGYGISKRQQDKGKGETDQAFRARQEMEGPLVRGAVEAVMADPGYLALNPNVIVERVRAEQGPDIDEDAVLEWARGQQRELLSRVVSRSRTRMTSLMKEPELQAYDPDAIVERVRAEQGPDIDEDAVREWARRQQAAMLTRAVGLGGE